MSEASEQAALMQFAALYQAQIPELAWLHHIPNGGRRDKVTAVQLKAQGVKTGVWDLFLPVPRNGKAGLYIEMKWGDNDLTKEQRAFRAFVEPHYATEVCYSWQHAATVLLAYLGYNPARYLQ